MRYFIFSILAVFLFSVQGVARNTTSVRSASTQSPFDSTSKQKDSISKEKIESKKLIDKKKDIITKKKCNVGYTLKGKDCVKVYCKKSSPLITPKIKPKIEKVKSMESTKSTSRSR